MADPLQRSGALAMETAFPQALREPLLRKVQFKQISRLDTLGWSYSVVPVMVPLHYADRLAVNYLYDVRR